MPARVAKPTFDLSELSASVPKIFEQAQLSTANHRKNHVALYKLQCESAKHTEVTSKGTKLVGERVFGDVFLKMVAKILPVKKGAVVVDRVVKFLSGYVKFINEKVAEARIQNPPDEEEEDEEDTTVSRLVARLLKWLFQGFVAKDKTVRYRVVQLVADMVANLGEIDEDVYRMLRSSLVDRITDKEPSIRVQAVVAFSKLSSSEDPAELENREQSVIDILIETLSYDSSPDVRRAALLHIPITPATISAILQRTRDTDATVRKLVYSAILEPNTLQHSDSKKLMGITHPRALSIAQRELIARNGLGDREASVKAAAGALVGSWVDVIAKGDPEDEADLKLDVQLAKVLKLYDLSENLIAEDALLSVFKNRADVMDNLEFGDAFWNNLTPEKAFLARVFAEHCIATNDQRRLENALPVVTALAFRVQATYNELLEDIQTEQEDILLGGVDEEQRAKKEEARLEKEFVIAEMCKLAVNLDYADEIGRRRMFQLVREMVSQEVLPESLVGRCLDVLRTLSANERDLIRVVVEVIHDLRDPNDPDDEVAREDDGETTFGGTPSTVRHASTGPKPAAEQTPEPNAHADTIDLRCLSLCIGMLERVNGTFEENSTLEGILGELIIPAVKRKELELREKGLISLGLCCLIAKRMALNSFQLFISQIQSAPEVLRIRVLQIVFDILMVHEGDFLNREGPQGEMIINFLLHILETDDSEPVQALLCVGIAKLLLAGMISDERVVKNLVLLYFSPSTAENQELKQCLSYFLPVYCYSSSGNQRNMQSIFLPVLEHMAAMYKELDEGEEMVTPSQVAGMFVEWTDPQRVVNPRGKAKDEDVHFDLATDIFKTLLTKSLAKEVKKVLCQVLGKLYIPDVLDDDKLRTLKLLMYNVRSRRPIKDTAANNAFTRFDAAFTKKFEKQLEDFSEEEYRQLEQLKGLFEFLDGVEIDDEDEEEEVPKKKPTRKRRSESIVTTTTDSESPPTSVGSKLPKGKGKAKRRRVLTSDGESDFGEDGSDKSQSPPPASTTPTRRAPRRSAAAKKPIVEEDSDSEEEEEGEESGDSTPAPPSRKAINPSRSTAIGKGRGITRAYNYDSDEEDEVNLLLASDE